MNAPDRSALEGRIAKRFDRDHCILVGRGTTGIALALRAAGVDGEVVCPTYTCSSAIYGVTYSDGTPTFADVAEDYTVTVESVSKACTPDTEAVMPIHMFGHPAPIEDLQAFCSENDLLLVEDTCQALGSTLNGDPVGSFGDLSVLSFGRKKQIDAGGGGAILTDDADLAAAVRREHHRLRPRDPEYLDRLSEHYRDIYYSIEDFSEFLPRAQQLHEPFPDVFRDLYMTGFDDRHRAAIAAGLKDLEQIASERRERAATYRSELRHPSITHPTPRGTPAMFRYSVVMESQQLRDHVVDYLRERDFHVSTLYTPAHPRFGDHETYEVAEDLANRTLNLWVTPDLKDSYVEECATVLLDGVSDFES